MIISLAVAFNDNAIGIKAAGSILPLFYLGNVFEAIRFNLHYSKRSIEKMLTLEKEVIHLSKAAHFGFAAASIAHDIKNHVFIVDLAVQKIQKILKSAKKEDLIFTPVKTISKHNSRILEITNLYMNVFKNNFSSDSHPASIREIANESIELVEQRLKDTGIKLIQEIEDFEINCNQAELSMCIVNLLKNAIDELTNSTDNTETPWIKIRTSANDAIIEVIDSGDGISHTVANSIFELGFSTKSNHDGNGIGLSISKQLLTRSGFDLNLIDNMPHTTFRISL